jgi:hypothetical protein
MEIETKAGDITWRQCGTTSFDTGVGSLDERKGPNSEETGMLTSLKIEEKEKFEEPVSTGMGFLPVFNHHSALPPSLPYLNPRQSKSATHSPITYSQPSSPIQTSCLLPFSTSILAPTPNVTFPSFSSEPPVLTAMSSFPFFPSGNRTVISPLRIR